MIKNIIFGFPKRESIFAERLIEICETTNVLLTDVLPENLPLTF
jgi:hypothetical protein